MPEQAVSDWEQIKILLDAAMDMPAAERPAWLEQACAGRSDWRREVESLLAVHDRIADGDTLKTPFLDGTPDTELHLHEAALIGRTVGSHRITGVIGRGGMGVVYRAEHVDPRLAQKVAIKLLRGGFRPDDLRRFREEQRILARLEHPHIARLLDAGVTDDGVPYLAMEYVDGVPLLEYGAARGLSLRQRLELFETVCAAVQAAHGNLVVHRDLKPSNILVDREGRVKLLDFGIAKLLDEEGGGGLPATRTGQHVLTPEYASPEQFRGEPVSVMSDVYSLGVVLYELLCGRRPYRLDGLSATEAERVVCLTDPRRPSQTDGPESRRLGGDLDLIVLTALSKEPGRRYPSASHLAADLQRYRAGLPIQARPDTVHYRMTKFVGRNRGPLAALALILLALVAGLVMTARQAAETRRRFEEVRGLANTLLFDIEGEIRDLPGTTPLRRRLVARALTHLDGLARDAARDPGLKSELAAAYEQLGEIQGDPHYASLGDLPACEASYRKALALREELVKSAPRDAARRRALANIVGRLGVVQSWAGDNDAACALSRRALGILDTLLVEQPGRPELRADRARVRGQLGWWRIWLGQTDDGMADTRAALATYDSLLTQAPGDLDLAIDRITCTLYLSDGHKFKGDYRAVADGLAPGLDQLEQLRKRYPDNLRVLRKKLSLLRQRGEGLEWVSPPEALVSYQEAVSVARDLFEVDATNFGSRRALASAYSHLGGTYLDAGRYPEAVRALVEARRHQQWLRDRDHDNDSDAANLATSRMWLAQSMAHMARYDSALVEALGAVAVRDSMLKERKPNPTALANLASAHGAVAEVYAGQASDPRTPRPAALAAWRAAGDSYRQSLDVFTQLEAAGSFREFWAPSRASCRRGLAAADSALR